MLASQKKRRPGGKGHKVSGAAASRQFTAAANAAVILKAIGFPVSMFTMLFAVARTPGWIAQWKEMIEDPNQKIGRPRQLYVGSPRRDYVAIDKRSQ